MDKAKKPILFNEEIHIDWLVERKKTIKKLEKFMKETEKKADKNNEPFNR